MFISGYPATWRGAEKSFVITRESWIGPRKDFLAISYMASAFYSWESTLGNECSKEGPKTDTSFKATKAKSFATARAHLTHPT
ncbi:unnamed protein product [Cylicostephanus goldi]|uniref:Uncharacterized protein n=1 Tax=Cylicostephanus goldi TaxID=71465 RepID=A0A3P6TSD7_CYLGO|nr:unnamed protein product [Cylicostephanus goldi]